MTETIDLASLLAEAGMEVSPVPQAGRPPEASEPVLIDSLRPADSPRLSGEDDRHTLALRQKLPYLPAILVNRRTMQVIDGMHRLQAARLEGAETIRAEFIDADEPNAFLLAVKANIDHGLPLTVADREAAAVRILSWYPYWSDRAVAAFVGLAATTVAAVRERSTVQSQQSNMRMGRDGRLRPMSAVEGRRRASEIMTARPEASLREVAREAGISLGTAHNVRERMRRGEDYAGEERGGRPDRSGAPCDQKAVRRRRRYGEPLAWPAVRDRIVKDPALRYAQGGLLLLRWFDSRAVGTGEWRDVIDAIPAHWIETIISVAYSCGNEWHELASALEQRINAAE